MHVEYQNGNTESNFIANFHNGKEKHICNCEGVCGAEPFTYYQRRGKITDGSYGRNYGSGISCSFFIKVAVERIEPLTLNLNEYKLASTDDVILVSYIQNEWIISLVVPCNYSYFLIM